MTWAMDELEARAARQLGRLRDFGDELAAIRVRASDPDELVTAEVDGNGVFVGLWLADGANELGSAQLGERITSTAMVAAQRAFAQRAVVTEQFSTEFAELLGTTTSRRG